MLRIPCPICGLRDHSEFAYLGDAGAVRPPSGESDRARWHSYVYLRANPAGPHREYWHHVSGCREWLIVDRDTATHEITGAARAREGPPENGTE